MKSIEFHKLGGELRVSHGLDKQGPGSVPFHVHVINPEDETRFDDHLTISDVQFITLSSPCREPVSSVINEPIRMHCVISIISVEGDLAKKLGEKRIDRLRRKFLGHKLYRTVFRFYQQNLLSESARNGESPYGISTIDNDIEIELEA